MGLMVWSPLAGGLLSGKYGPGASSNAEGRRVKFDFPPVDEARGQACIAALREVAAKHDTSVASVALAWILAKIRRAHVRTPVTNAHLVCRLLLAKKKNTQKPQAQFHQTQSR